MAFSKITKDMNIIAALDDEPNDVGGLTAAQLKAKFDEGGLAIKEKFNEHIDDLAKSTAAASIGAKDLNGDPTDVQGAIDAVAVAVIGQIPDNSITTEKLRNGAVTNAKLADPAQNLIGSIAHSVRTDLGDKWALCNGDPYDPEEYPDFAAVWPYNITPKDNPNPKPTQANSAMSQMYNGEFASVDGSFLTIDIYTRDGAYKATTAVTDMTAASGAKIWAVDADGTRYVFFVRIDATTVEIYTTTDFAVYTRVKQVSTLASDGNTSSIPNGVYEILAKYDGSYFYYMRTYSTGRSIAIFDNSFDLVREVTKTAWPLYLRACEGRTYALWYDDTHSATELGIALCNGNVPTDYSNYRTTTPPSTYYYYHNMIAFNDEYDLLWSGSALRFIPRDGTSPIKEKTASLGAAVFIDGSGTKLLTCGSNNYYYCPTDAPDPTQESAWFGPIAFSSSVDYGNFSNGKYRYNDTPIIFASKILRYPFLPTFASDGYYTYIKVKE